MSLTLHRSHRIEWLADALAAELAAHPQPPLVPERVVVQSLSLRRWLSYQLAERLGVTMHIEFPFPAQLVEETLTQLVPDSPPSPIFRREVMPWRIHAVLPGLLRERDFIPLRRYVSDDPLKLWHLAAQLANVFDRYLAYRPDLLLRWDAGEIARDEKWQARLWLAISKGHAHAAALLRSTLTKESADASRFDDLPLFAPLVTKAARSDLGVSRFSLFGISSLAPFHLQVLESLAASAEIHLYLLTPTREYWGDIRSEREQARLRRWMSRRGANPEAHVFAEAHPLLASLGKLGREFHEALLDLTPTAEFDYFETPPRTNTRRVNPARLVASHTPTLLASLQESLLTLELPEHQQPIAADDRSLQFHSCHSPLRELEVLHDQLLALFAADSSLEPRDVLVAVTDMDQYAPCIEAVFGAPESEPVRFPFSIADRAAHQENEVAGAFLRLLQVIDSRHTASAVLGLLDCAPIRARFEISEMDLPLLRDWVTRSGIRWGRDEHHRTELGLPPVREHTWRFGLDRLLLGFALPPEGSALFQGILPDGDIEGDLADLLGCFAAFCAALFRIGEALTSLEAPASDWSLALRSALAEFCSGEESLAEPYRTTAAQIDALAGNTALAAHTAPLPFHVIHAHLTAAFADHESGGGFLRGGLTFCSLKPMRAIPHRIIVLLGLNDDAFPRTSRPPAFDLTAAHPRPGDRTLRDDDRYLFLEMLLSARDTLLLSYCGQSKKDNSSRPPSVLAAELLDHVSRHFTPTSPHASVAAQLITRHRLQAFSPRYFTDPAGTWFSYSQENARAAAQTFVRRSEGSPFGSALSAGPIRREVTLAALTDALTQPARFFGRQRLGMALPFEEAAIEDSEPITFNSLERYSLSARLTTARLHGTDPLTLRAPVRAGGMLPHGYAGDSAFADSDLVARHLTDTVALVAPGRLLPPRDLTLTIGEWTLQAPIAASTESALIFVRPGRLRGRDRLGAWLAHLVVCAAESVDLPKRTVGVGTDDTVIFPAVPAEVARQQLTRLLALYERAYAEPLPFFPECSLAYASASVIPSSRQKRTPLQIAEATWEGAPFQAFKPESADEWNAAIWRDHPEPLGEPFQRLAVDVFEPMIRALQPNGEPAEPARKGKKK